MNTWRSETRSANHAASQLSGGGPNDVDDTPARDDYDNDDDELRSKS